MIHTKPIELMTPLEALELSAFVTDLQGAQPNFEKEAKPTSLDWNRKCHEAQTAGGCQRVVRLRAE